MKKEQPEPIEGFIVHSSFSRSTRTPTLYLIGRLKNGETFAVVEERMRPGFYIRESDTSRVLEYIKNNGGMREDCPLRTIDGEKCEKVIWNWYSGLSRRPGILLTQGSAPMRGISGSRTSF